MRQDTEPQPSRPMVAASDATAHPPHSERSLRATKDTDPNWPTRLGGETSSSNNDTEPGSVPLEALDATLQGFRRRPRVEIEEALETNGADAARGHVDAHVPPRRAEANAPSRRVIVEGVSTPSPSTSVSASSASLRANVTAPMAALAVPRELGIVRAPAPGPAPAEEEAQARMVSTVARPPIRSWFSLPVLFVFGVVLAGVSVAVLLALRERALSSATPLVSNPSSTTTSPALSGSAVRAPAPPASSVVAESASSPPAPVGAAPDPATVASALPSLSAVRAGSSSTTTTARPNPPLLIPTSSIHSAEPKHVSPPTDILRTQ